MTIGASVTFDWTAEESHVGESMDIYSEMANASPYKRTSGTDDNVMIPYSVSPTVPARVT